MNPGLFSSATAEWETPTWLFEALDARFQFTLDPCCTSANAKCARYFTRAEDGLAQSWSGHRVFMNPPYGREIAKWVAKARLESEAGCTVVGLLPARTDARWWHQNVMSYADVHFIAGRLKFGNAENSAPFPSAIALWF